MNAKNGLKVCSKCRIELSVSEYHKNCKQPDGYHNWCKSCLIKWRDEYKPKKHAYDKTYCLEHAEEKQLAANEWYYANHEYGKQVRREYHESHKERHSELGKQWRKNNPEKVREIHGRQKAKRREMGFIKLWKNPFPEDVEIDWHHINKMLVIPMPRKLHNKCSHLNPEEHRERCNKWLYYLYGIDLEKLIG